MIFRWIDSKPNCIKEHDNKKKRKTTCRYKLNLISKLRRSKYYYNNNERKLLMKVNCFLKLVRLRRWISSISFWRAYYLKYYTILKYYTFLILFWIIFILSFILFVDSHASIARVRLIVLSKYHFNIQIS